MTVPHLIPAVQAPTAPAAFAALRANGLRLSTARRLLLRALFDADRPLSAEELAGDGDVASAYRNLEVLERLGLVAHLHLGHGPGLCQPAGRPREFALCEGCGEVSPLPEAALDRVRAAVLEAAGCRARFTVVAGGAALTARRRALAAGVASFVGINVAALFAAVEFGLQPELFTAADGTPLYAPFHLAQTIPAMMFAHLTVAGPVEFERWQIAQKLHAVDRAVLRRTREPALPRPHRPATARGAQS